MQASLTADAARFVVTDQGRRIQCRRRPRPHRCRKNLEQPSGRGIFLMKTFLDEVSYNHTGNEVTLLKRRQESVATARD